MLRQVVQRAVVLRHRRSRTMMTTAAQKRALNKQQLEGTKAAAAASKPGGDKGTGSSTPPPPSSSSPTPQPSGKSNNNTLLMGAAAVAAVGVGGYLYTQQPQEEEPVEATTASVPPSLVEKELDKKTEEPAKKEEPKVQEAVVKKEEPKVEEAPEPAKVEEPPEEKPVVQEEVVALEKQTVKAEEPKQEEPVKEENVGHRVTTVVVPPPGSRPTTKPAEVSHPPDGNRVAMGPPPSKQQDTTPHLWTAEAAAKELRSSDDAEASSTLQSAHKALRANLDDALLQDVDQLSDADLRVRVVQLAAEMKERTKWEAVRLKEFLALKEKETADKYMAILQEQRLEFEALLARRLLEQEEALTRANNAALHAKDDSIQSVVNAAAEAQEAEHKVDLESTEQRLTRELSAKYEADYSQQLANTKAAFAKELQTKLTALQDLSAQLSQLESSLEASKTFESGSQKAHRVSAAAMALGAKLETNKGAPLELAALSMAAENDGVIASALRKLPGKSVQEGVPTLSELQTRFESIKKKARHAAMIPKGWSGLEGQLLGMAFSTLSLSPSPDEPPPPGEDAAPDYVLVRAQRHVQLGELDRAVEQLDKLDGQAAYVVRDWKQAAKDRIAVENALKVIKMECALLNESHSGGTSSEGP